jgi:RNA polymerase sigma-70 factor (ECF subfamily)
VARPTNINVIFSLTVMPHEKSLLRRGRRLVGNDADARDLVQETLERALRTFHGFRPGTAVWAWLRTIMNSVWIDGWRRRQAAAKIYHLPSIDLLAAAEPEPEVGAGAGAGTDEEILERLPEAIAQLPPIFRQVLELRLQANRSYGEIAECLGIPSRTVGTRILRARRQLRAILEKEISEEATPRAARGPARTTEPATTDLPRYRPRGAAPPASEEMAALPARPARKTAWQRAGV